MFSREELENISMFDKANYILVDEKIQKVIDAMEEEKPDELITFKAIMRLKYTFPTTYSNRRSWL